VVAQSATQSLAELSVGSSGTIVGIPNMAEPRCRRLRDLGFLPGTAVTVVRRAPLGDPTVFEVRGYRAALRKSESGEVVVAIQHPTTLVAS
jgi:ferrous iron transport protein A